MIKLSKISKTYDNGVEALSQVSFEIKSAEVTYILGESGSGKSTLLKIIAGLEDAIDGSVFVDEEEITGPSHHLVPGYDHLAYVPQDFKLQQFWTVKDNIGKKISHYPYEDKEARIKMLLQLCKLEDYADRYPRELSGGQQQRIAMAAAVADEPDVVLLDEPFSNLDLPMKAEVRKEIIGMLRTLGITVLLVSHDPAEALAVADQIIILNQGKLEQQGNPVNVYRNPKSLYAAKFLGPINEMTFEKKKVFIRPEHLIIDPKGKFKATVEECIFMGMHYHTYLLVEQNPNPILCYTKVELKKSTTVQFSIK
ncbi:ABC-type Fe3+/spermidine/putrescine transport systems, ATPase components [Reichenbachiella faecimaris]|uniref:ABC-type Fe3+/spermidine/putrescine transport systems, ATPase components n=1 Tax=Reichenbachiella faecimaris TaxID=692418 RepID=A0A1W2G9X0_REIFA|nr:ABC transporter ATP-binding protein [Reichenbachiella faecimaris]SMD33158.1 ABC-type Fe3+/spermidine/putrescine transport systems, ATPase components [Reichenbachiella faecimaris]